MGGLARLGVEDQARAGALGLGDPDLMAVVGDGEPDQVAGERGETVEDRLRGIDGAGGGEMAEGKAELILGKQRNGPTGVIDLFFQKAYTRFDSVARSGPERGPGTHTGAGFGP